MTFPTTPKQEPLNQTVGNVTIEGRVFVSGQDEDGVSVSVVQFPTGGNYNVDGALKGAISGAATASGGTITEQREDRFQGRPARTATIHAKGTDIYIEAAFDTSRLVGIVGAPRPAYDAALASFKFLP
jgi:hypothetical protein